MLRNFAHTVVRVMFMHEYKVLAASSSTDRLRKSLKTEDFEKYGEPFTPEFVYEAIRQLSRFASMRVCATFTPGTTYCLAN